MALIMEDRLRVTHVVLSLDVGGLERIVIDLLRQAPHLGQDVSVICLERPGEMATQAISAGATVRCLHKKPGIRPEIVSELTECFRSQRPDIVHTHQIAALFYVGRAARDAGVPAVIHTEHGNHFARQSGMRLRWRRRLLVWRASRFARRFICVSKDVAGACMKYGAVPRPKVSVVPNGINCENFQDRTRAEALRSTLGLCGSPVVGTVGRLSAIKRQDVLIEAFAKIQQLLPDAKLLIVGDGPEMPRLRALASNLGIGQSVIFAGYQERPQDYLNVMDVFVLTSQMEGMPLAVLEAWAAGLPVVASHVGGIPEIVHDGQDGLLFEFGDEAALLKHLREVLTNACRADALAAAGRAKVERLYSIAQTAAKYHAEYLAAVRTSDSHVACLA